MLCGGAHPVQLGEQQQQCQAGPGQGAQAAAAAAEEGGERRLQAAVLQRGTQRAQRSQRDACVPDMPELVSCHRHHTPVYSAHTLPLPPGLGTLASSPPPCRARACSAAASFLKVAWKSAAGSSSTAGSRGRLGWRVRMGCQGEIGAMLGQGCQGARRSGVGKSFAGIAHTSSAPVQPPYQLHPWRE